MQCGLDKGALYSIFRLRCVQKDTDAASNSPRCWGQILTSKLSTLCMSWTILLSFPELPLGDLLLNLFLVRLLKMWLMTPHRDEKTGWVRDACTEESLSAQIGSDAGTQGSPDAPKSSLPASFTRTCRNTLSHFFSLAGKSSTSKIINPITHSAVLQVHNSNFCHQSFCFLIVVRICSENLPRCFKKCHHITTLAIQTKKKK